MRARELRDLPTSGASSSVNRHLIPFDAGARAVLEGTFGEARRLGSGHVGTGHLLLDAEGGSGALSAAGVPREATDAAVQTLQPELRAADRDG